MINKNTEKLLQDRREAQKILDNADKELNVLLNGYMNKRSDLLEKQEKLIKDTIEPILEEISILEGAIIEICKNGGMKKFSGDKHSVIEQEDVSFSAKDWDSVYKFIDEYKGEFDVHSILKKSLNSTALKKYYKENALCPDGIEVQPYKKWGWRKK